MSRMLEKGYDIIYNSTVNKGEFIIRKSDGHTKVFKQSTKGLFYHDTLERKSDTDAEHELLFINTVDNNSLKYTNRDFNRAKLARQLQIRIGRPSTRQFGNIIENNMIPNCPVTVGDIQKAEDIFGPDLGSLKGKTVRQRQGATVGDVTVVPE